MAQEGHYEIIDLGTLGGTTSSASGINAAGQVTGLSTTDSGVSRAFLWTPEGGLSDVGIPDMTESEGRSINDNGVIAGRYGTPTPKSQAWLWQGGASTSIHSPAQRSSALAVNNANEVVGWYALDDTRRAAFLCRGNGKLVTGPAGSELLDISNSDENHGALATGFWPDLNTGTPTVAVYYVEDNTVLVSAIPGIGRAINWDGTIVGDSGDVPFFCRAEDNYAAPVFIAPLPGYTSGRLYDINEQSVAVGQNSTTDGASIGVIYGTGVLSNINDLCSGDWFITDLRGINNDGWMAGTGIRNEESHAVLLIPLDEDGDGVSYYRERFLNGSSPLSLDSDDDGNSDGDVAEPDTVPLLPSLPGGLPWNFSPVTRAALALVPDSITLTRPNGGETLYQGATAEVTWLSTGIAGSTIKITVHKGNVSSVLAGSTPNDGSFSWKIPATYPVGPGVSIEISSVLFPEVVDFSDGSFSIASPPPAGTIVVTVPSGGESYYPGQTVPIAWTTSGTAASNVQILARSLGQTYVVAASTPNDGRFDWTMPRAQTPGNDYVVEVLPISTATASTITVTSPNGGQTYLQGAVVPVTWNSTGNPGSDVQIIARGGGQSFALAASTANDGAFSWPVPLNQLPASDYRIEVRSLSSPTVGDSSNADFVIQRRPPITVVSPNGGETLIRGSSAIITWTSTSDAGSTVKIVARKSGYGSVLASATPNDGSYSWKIPATYPLGPGVTIEISSSAAPIYTDTSDGAFSIAP